MKPYQKEFITIRLIIYPLIILGIVIFHLKGGEQAIGRTNTIFLFLSLFALIMAFSFWNKRYLRKKYHIKH